MAAGLKEVPGKPLVNSVNGENERLEAVLPLVKDRQATVMALAIGAGANCMITDPMKLAPTILVVIVGWYIIAGIVMVIVSLATQKSRPLQPLFSSDGSVLKWTAPSLTG